MNGENPSDFGSDKETVYHCAAALGRRVCPLSLAPLAKAGLRLPASASLPLASCWPRPQQLLPVSAAGGGRRRCSQRGSPWQAGPLPTGRLRPDMAQKGGPCYRGQRFLDKRTLSSCRESWQRSTTVSEKIRLCSFRVGLTGTPVAPPLGELSPKVTERARTPTESFSEPFYSKNFLKIQFIGLLFCYTPVRTKRHRREEE